MKRAPEARDRLPGELRKLAAVLEHQVDEDRDAELVAAGEEG